MSKKRRIFDIDLPDDLPPAPQEGPPETFPAGKVAEPLARRGPMATAIAETAGATRERQVVEAEIRAENDALAHEHVRLKKLGLVIDLVPLDAVEMYKLVRDRKKGIDPELKELKESIRELGLSNPIRVEARPDGRFELIQGYRRLSAFRELLQETGDADRWGRVPAAVSQPGDSLEALYRKMVDENLVRKDISFAEMAMLAIDYAGDPQTEVTDADKAVAILYKSAGYQKRSYIRAFIRLVGDLGKDLQFAQDIPRALGLSLAQRLAEDPEFYPALRAELAGYDNRSAQGEVNLLRRMLGEPVIEEGREVPPAAPDTRPALKPAKAKTSFQIDRREGRARCTASAGCLEVRLNRDFSTIDRRRLEAAIRSMLDRLDD